MNTRQVSFGLLSVVLWACRPNDTLPADATGERSAQTEDALVWVNAAKLDANDGASGDSFGNSIATHGGTIAIGAPEHMPGGAVYVFVEQAGAWVLEQKVLSNDLANGDWLGFAVALEGDTMVATAYQEDAQGTDSGSAYVFTRSGGQWTQQGKLIPLEGDSFDNFGFSVALSGDTVVVGDPNDSLQAVPQPGQGAHGSIYVYLRGGAVWTQQQKLWAPTPTPSAVFGMAVDVSGDSMLIGEDGTSGLAEGNAHVFTRSGGVWSLEVSLSGAGVSLDPGDVFGSAVALDGDTALVGAQGDDDAAAGAGAAYVLVRSGGVWSLEQKITASDAAVARFFGSKVALHGDLAVVGAQDLDYSGSLYVFARSGGVWTEQQKIDGSTAAYDAFGADLDVDLHVVAGTPGDDSVSMDQGSAQVFTLKKEFGEICSDVGECESGFCVDGVCCASACGDGAVDDCVTCDAAGECVAELDGQLCDGGSCDGGTCLPEGAGGGGVGGAGEGGGGGSSSASASSGAGGGGTSSDDSGCSCHTVAPRPATSWWLLALPALVIARRRFTSPRCKTR
jgi:hypothetical protein